MLSLGLTVWQATLADIIGSTFIAVALITNGQPGGRWNIPFAVANRTAWGVRGSWFVVCNRLILSLCWCVPPNLRRVACFAPALR